MIMSDATPRYDLSKSDRARREAEQAAALEAVKRAFGFGACQVKTVTDAPLQITRWLMKRKKPTYVSDRIKAEIIDA